MTRVLGVVLAAGKGSRMKSDLPKVLHQVGGKAMVTRCVDAMRGAGATDIAVIVGYRRELVMEELGDAVQYVVQDEQLGTGHAVACAKEIIAAHGGLVAIAYGDNPLLSSSTIAELIERAKRPQVAGALLTISLDNPPKAGRIVRDDNGKMTEIIEDQDCTEEQRQIKEINAGTYCFKADDLLAGLAKLRADNAQGELYLTDVPGLLIEQGKDVETFETTDIFEVLGVNDRRHLEFAELAKEIRHAETLYDVIDAAAAMGIAPGDGGSGR